MWSWKLVRCPKCYCPFSAVSKPIFATNSPFAACVKIYKNDMFASLEIKACSSPELFRRILISEIWRFLGVMIL